MTLGGKARIARLPRLAAIGLALTLGAAGGAAANALSLPLPWMIGSMLVCTIASAAGAPLAMAMPLRTAMVVVLGVMLGSGFTPEILDVLAQWGISLLAVAGYIAVSTAAGLLYFRRACGYDRVTAYFAATPGGLNEMILVGGAMGGDVRIIALTHASRILLVVMTLPFAFRLITDLDPAARQDAAPSWHEMAFPDIAVLLACGVAGFVLARALRVPAAAVIGPMLLSAAAHLAELTQAAPPAELVAAAQVAVGAAVGARFAGTELRLILLTVGRAAGGAIVLVAITLIFAAGLHLALGIDLRSLVLAYAPGGLAEMSLIAISLQADAAFVAIHHIVRIFLVILFAPLVFRLLGWRRREEN